MPFTVTFSELLAIITVEQSFLMVLGKVLEPQCWNSVLAQPGLIDRWRCRKMTLYSEFIKPLHNPNWE